MLCYLKKDLVAATAVAELPLPGVGSYLPASEQVRYEITDHLGNLRVSFTYANEELTVVEAHDYYPHGGILPGRTFSGGGASPLRYQGQEFDAEVGLTAFNLRQYDARLGRWQTPDPYGQHYSPYLAMSNNPVSFTDPDGGYDGYWVDGIRVFGIDMTDLLDRYGRSGQAFDLAIYTTDANGRLTYGDELYNVIMDNGNLRSAEYSYAEMLNVTEALYQQPDGSIVSVSATVFRNPHTGGVWAEANGVVAMCRKEYGTLADRLDVLHQLAAERDAQHLAADIAGFVPGLGEPADILNIGLYIRDGAYNSAGWSTLAAIPALGVLATLYKWSKRADNAVGAAKTAGTRGYRYVSESEVQAIKDTGFLRGGRPGETFFTKDHYKSAEHAQDRLSLPNLPTHRIEFEITNNPMLLRNGTKVEPIGNLPGKGHEFMTSDPVQVDLINVQPLRP